MAHTTQPRFRLELVCLQLICAIFPSLAPCLLLVGQNDDAGGFMIFKPLFDKETSTYTYLLADAATRDAVLIDAVQEQTARDLLLIDQLGLNLLFTLETHVHADHITGSGALREATGAQITVPRGGVQGADRELGRHDVLRFGRHELVTLETPGHTQTCRTYLLDNTMVFTGDALFVRGTGRTDFQGGSARRLYQSITELFSLPDDVLVYPGHDYNGNTVSTIAEEKCFNPRLAATGFHAVFRNLR